MSGTRVVVVYVETECKHGNFHDCGVEYNHSYHGWMPCPGGSRRTLTPGEFVLIEKVDELVGEFGLRLLCRGDHVTPERATTELLNLLDTLAGRR